MLILIFTSFFLFSNYISATNDINIIAGKSLKCLIVSTSGHFSELEGSQFIIKFVSKNQYEIKLTSLHSAGIYIHKGSHIILKETNGIHNHALIEILLKFSGNKNGIFTSHYLNQKPLGQQSGIFIIQ